MSPPRCSGSPWELGTLLREIGLEPSRNHPGHIPQLPALPLQQAEPSSPAQPPPLLWAQVASPALLFHLFCHENVCAANGTNKKACLFLFITLGGEAGREEAPPGLNG